MSLTFDNAAVASTLLTAVWTDVEAPQLLQPKLHPGPSGPEN